MDDGNEMEAVDFQVLADSVRRSGSISTLTLIDWSAANMGAFVTRLSTGIASNYTLRGVRVNGRLDVEATRSWLAISETMRRNSGILARAVEFMEGRKLDRYFAEALERVSLYSVLIEDLAELCHTPKGATALSVKAHLSGFGSMDSFMRLAGVVRERVVCYPRDDGLLQLDQLNEHCWSLLRRYLMLEDVKISVTKTAHT